MSEATPTAVPSSLTLYRKAILHRGSGGDALPGDRLQLADQPIDAERLWRYQQLCGFRVSDLLPPTYLHLLAFPLGIALMTKPEFPFPLLGLVHVGNEISQHRPVHADERVTVRTRAAGLRSHPSGRVVDLLSEALVGDEPVWQELSSYLHREQAAGADQDRARQDRARQDRARQDRARQDRARQDRAGQDRAGQQPAANGPVIRWQAAADIGRRYAAVSGDRNPIHLHALTARVFGFRAAIAHGMWLKARTLAAFAGRLPERLRVEVAFKTPVFLPSTVELQAAPTDPGWRFQLTGVRSGKPHLTGIIGD
jgi:acyl dehydratase